MKANSRRRVLISSMAMLLVALVALSTATYAWFTSSTSATASELSVKTVKSSELKLSSIDKDWTDTLEYNVIDKVLKPASSADGKKWFTATASGKGASTADKTTVTQLNSLDGYVFADQLNVQNAGKADVDNVMIKFTLGETQLGGDNTGYLRLALVEVDKRATATSPATIKGNFANGVYAKNADSASAITGTVVDTDGKITDITTTPITAKAGTSVEFPVGLLKGAGATLGEGEVNARFYNLYIWFEGQDTDCKDANAGNEMPEITFTVEGDTVVTK